MIDHVMHIQVLKSLGGRPEPQLLNDVYLRHARTKSVDIGYVIHMAQNRAICQVSL